MSDPNINFGKDGYTEEPPLTSGEQKFMESISRELAQAMAAFSAWTERCADKEPSRTVCFTITLTGDICRRFMYLKALILDGYKATTAPEFVRTIVEQGILRWFNHIAESRLQHAGKLMMYNQMPPELREATVTNEIRGTIRQIAAARSSSFAQVFGTPNDDFPVPKPIGTNANPGILPQQMQHAPICGQCGKTIVGTPVEYKNNYFCNSGHVMDYIQEQHRREARQEEHDEGKAL